jgi:hypothetical protein
VPSCSGKKPTIRPSGSPRLIAVLTEPAERTGKSLIRRGLPSRNGEGQPDTVSDGPEIQLSLRRGAQSCGALRGTPSLVQDRAACPELHRHADPGLAQRERRHLVHKRPVESSEARRAPLAESRTATSPPPIMVSGAPATPSVPGRAPNAYSGQWSQLCVRNSKGIGRSIARKGFVRTHLSTTTRPEE